MNLRRGGGVLAVVIGIGVQLGAQTLYDITFSSPTHMVGQTVATGSGSETPTSIPFGSPTVVASFGTLTSQALKFDMTGNSPSFYYDQIQLQLPSISGPVLRLEFDFTSSQLVGSAAHFAILYDTPTVRSVSFDNSGALLVASQGHGIGWINSSFGPFADNTFYRVRIDTDLVNETWSIFLNDQLAGSTAFYPEFAISTIRLGFGLKSALSSPDASAVAIDNLNMTVIPEANATAIYLLLLAPVGMRLRRRFHARR